MTPAKVAVSEGLKVRLLGPRLTTLLENVDIKSPMLRVTGDMVRPLISKIDDALFTLTKPEEIRDTDPVKISGTSLIIVTSVKVFAAVKINFPAPLSISCPKL